MSGDVTVQGANICTVVLPTTDKDWQSGIIASAADYEQPALQEPNPLSTEVISTRISEFSFRSPAKRTSVKALASRASDPKQ
jgi:hypothetical protein